MARRPGVPISGPFHNQHGATTYDRPDIATSESFYQSSLVGEFCIGVNEMFWTFKAIRLLVVAFACLAGVGICRAEVVAHYKFDETVGATSAVNLIGANGGNG